MKKTILLLITLFVLLLFTACAEKTPDESPKSSKQPSASYSDEYIQSIRSTLEMHWDELGIVAIGDGENKLCVSMLDTSDEMLAKVEAIIGSDAMEACVFDKSGYPQTT